MRCCRGAEGERGREREIAFVGPFKWLTSNGWFLEVNEEDFVAQAIIQDDMI